MTLTDPHPVDFNPNYIGTCKAHTNRWSATGLRTSLSLPLLRREPCQSVSNLVNVAIKEVLLEDLDDLNSFDERKNETPIRFEDFVKELKANGKI